MSNTSFPRELKAAQLRYIIDEAAMKIYHPFIFLPFFVFLAILPACSPLGGSTSQPTVQELTYQENATQMSPTPNPACTIHVSTGPTAPELTYAENLSNNPPPPCDLQALIVPNGIQLRWDLPPAVPVPHHYSDRVLYYIIYRRTESSGFVFLAKTSDFTFLDQSAVSGGGYFYTITAMHENEMESSRSPEVIPTSK
jgi:hypothetical protein